MRLPVLWLVVLVACTESGAVRYRTAKVERGSLEAAVTATGTVRAASTVQVSSPIPGQITEIGADFKTPVKKGQVLARLERTVIRAPVDGTVVLRNAEVGQTVGTGVLFSIAPDLREVLVDAPLEARDATRVKRGMTATFTVDALPRRRYTGEVRSVGRTVVAAAANADLTLLPGMSAKLRIVLERRDGVLKVPNAALDGARVWVLEAEKPTAVAVRVGITDGVSTELMQSPLAEGAQVIVGMPLR